MRTPITINSFETTKNNEKAVVHVVLCDDGSMWQILGNIRGVTTDSVWTRIPDIPQEQQKV
jgi:hypothetical protein